MFIFSLVFVLVFCFFGNMISNAIIGRRPYVLRGRHDHSALARRHVVEGRVQRGHGPVPTQLCPAGLRAGHCNIMYNTLHVPLVIY